MASTLSLTTHSKLQVKTSFRVPSGVYGLSQIMPSTSCFAGASSSPDQKSLLTLNASSNLCDVLRYRLSMEEDVGCCPDKTD